MVDGGVVSRRIFLIAYTKYKYSWPTRLLLTAIVQY